VLINKTPFELKVKKKIPCNRTTGEQLAIIEKGGSYVVTDDFLVESSAMGIKSILIGDPFDLWVGDSTWMDITATFHVTYDESIPHNAYLAYEQIGSSAATEKGMYVILKNEIENAKVYIKSEEAKSEVGGRPTLCQLKKINSTCLVRTDFLAEILDGNGKVVATSDQFSAWWGDGSYVTANTTMVLTRKNGQGDYLTMTNAGYTRTSVETEEDKEKTKLLLLPITAALFKR
jgi:hypothetical protein|tara:strand:- start:34 stop:729 length:696 start_codon:yes stop_codon:yes gene_type:complete